MTFYLFSHPTYHLLPSLSLRERTPEVVQKFQTNNIRVSLFINPSIKTLENLDKISTNRVELYTYDYAHNYSKNQSEAIKSYIEVSSFIKNKFPHIELNAGHDLNLENLDYFLKSIDNIKEVSIGHALICDTFEFGLENTIKCSSDINEDGKIDIFDLILMVEIILNN